VPEASVVSLSDRARFKEAEVRNLLAVLVAVGLAAVPIAAQAPPAATRTGTANAASTWKVPRTPDGHPDLQGVWANNSVTPTERPKQWKDKPSLTDAELQELKALVARYVSDGGDAVFQNFVQVALDAKDKGEYKQLSYDRATGNYNEFWMAGRDWDNRTSLITDPPNGLMPPLTPEAQAKRDRARGALVQVSSENGPSGRADGPEDRGLSERCITFGAPRMGAAYNSYFQIVQSPEAVAILQETIHDARIVPTDGRPHLPPNVRQVLGDPRGHWEGDTLVVDTTNYLPISTFSGSTENVRVIERYTRVSPDYINWEVTAIDPATWTRPWTLMIRLKRVNEQLYEYACHEGNYALPGILAGARAAEKASAEAAMNGTKKSK
jgi:hypothetical protein